ARHGRGGARRCARTIVGARVRHGVSRLRRRDSRHQHRRAAPGRDVGPRSRKTVRVTVAQTLGWIARHPMDFVATRWNWKAALVSALLRGTIFFSAAVEFGLPAALNALIVDAMFRVPMAGMCAAVIQELRSAEPPWAAAATAVLGVPAASHAIEITVH